MATQRELADQAKKIWEMTRNQILQQVQPLNPRAFSHGVSPKANWHNRSPYSNPNQGVALLSGRTPNDADITRLAMQNPEYRRLQERLAAGQRKAATKAERGNKPVRSQAPQPALDAAAVGAQQQPAQDPMALFNYMFMQSQMAEDRANAAGEARYGEGKGELTDKRTRNQERVGNWGYAAQADIDERMQAALGNAKANAAARGQSNSNITDAYSLRAARDTAREQQRVSEMRDSRLAEYDTRDTNDLVGFIERRNDIGPNYDNLLQMAMQYGQSEANRQSQEQQQAAMMAALQQGGGGSHRGTGGQGRSDVRLPVRPGPQGGAMPMFLNGTPGQMANGMFSGIGWQQGVTSNSYPIRRTPDEYASIAQVMAERDAQQAKANDIKKWNAGQRSMIPSYGMPTYPYV